MTPAEFCAAYRPTADQVSVGTGIDPIALLAQWWNETGGGVSWAGAPFNLGNIEDGLGKVIAYPSLDAFAQACISVFRLPFYAAVLRATNAIDQLAAIVASPWAGGHYGGSLMAEYTLLEEFELTPDQDAILREVGGILNGTVPTRWLTALQYFEANKTKIDALLAGGGGGVEPAEPKTVTLSIPAQTISGTLT